MPDGLHLLIETGDPELERRRLVNVLSGFAQRFGKASWQEVPEPRVVPDRLHLERATRYIPLNPCRAGYVDDPLCWYWTTHRDLVGAVADPWVTPERLARALGRRVSDFVERHHAYVSADPTVDVEGAPLPIPALPGELTRWSLERIQLAAVAAHRAHPDDARRSGP